MTLSIEVYEADNATLVGEIEPGQFAAAAGRCVPLAGQGEITLLRFAFTGLGGLIVGMVPNPALDLIEHQRLIRFTDDHDDPEADPFVWTMEIEGIDDTPLSPSDEAGEEIVVTGRDWLSARTDKMQVLPDRGLDREPWHPTRWFNFSADRLRDDDPDGPQGVWPFGFDQEPAYDGPAVYFARPPGYYDTAGLWLAHEDTRTDFAPPGFMYFRGRRTYDEDVDVLMQGAFDDVGQIWDNGVPILRAHDGAYKGRCVESRYRAAAGEHVISGWVRNLNALRMGVLGSCWTVTNGMPDELLWRLDESWVRVLAFPADPPGFTPTEVIRLVLDNWDDTYAPADPIVPSFISASDTASAEVDEVTDLTAKAPADSVLTFLKHLLETYLDIREDPESLGIDAWIRGTAGSDLSATVQLQKGTAAKVTHSERSNERANTAMVSGSQFAPFAVDHPSKGSDETYSVSLDMGDASRATAEKFALMYIDALLNFRYGVAGELLPEGGPKPGKDFNIYDTIGVLDRDDTVGPHRVASVGFMLDASSTVVYSAAFEQPSALLDERLNTLIRGQMPGGAAGRTSLPAPVEPHFTSNEPPSEDELQWQWDGPLGEVQLYIDGVAVTDGVIDASDLVADGDTKTVVVRDNATRRFTKDVSQATITAGGGSHSPKKKFTQGRYVQAMSATATENDDDTTTITISVLTA